MEIKKIKTGHSDRIFYILTGILITLFFLVVLYPIVFVIAASFSSGDAVSAGKVFLWPVDFCCGNFIIAAFIQMIWSEV